MSRRRFLTGVVAVAVVGGALAVAPGAAAAPAGGVDARAELESLYRSMHAVVEHGVAAGAPVDQADPAPAPDVFEAQLARISDEDLAPFADVFDRTSIVADYASLAASTTPAEAPPAVVAGPADADPPAARSFGLSSAFGAVVVPDPPEIPPPAPPYVPTSPVGPTGTLTCPEVPPGRDWGSFAIFTANVTMSAVGAVAAAQPAQLHIIIPILAGVATTITIANPLKIVAQVAKGLAAEAVLTLEWLKDRYGDCGGVDLFAAGPNIENTAVQLYGISSRANDQINAVNRGLIALSDQVQVMQSSQEELQRLRIQQALAAPLTGVANVAYVLPVAEGGFLDGQPVGVRAVVEDTLAAARAAHLPVSAAAIVYQVQANLALTMGSYANAFRYYQRTYQSIGR